MSLWNFISKYRYLKIQPWIVWGLGAAFFFAEYFARIAPSVMTSELMKTFSMGAIGVSIISACFYFPYVMMQVPAGSLVDRFGAHRLLTIMSVLCAMGSALFAISHTAWLACLSRAIIGFGAAFAFVGTLKLASVWFERQWFGFLAGMTQGLGMLGASLGASIFSILVMHMGWRFSMAIIATIILLISILIGLLVRDTRPSLLSHQTYNSPLEIKPLRGLIILFRNPSSWIISLYSGFIYAPTAVFGELWSVHFLESTRHLTHDVAARAEGAIFIGLAVGCPLIGWISDSINRRKPLLIISSIFSLIIISVILFVTHLSTLFLFLFLFLYGVSNSGVALSYAVAGELNPRSMMGISIAFTNMASILLGGFFFQPLFGFLLDLHWSHQMINGVKFYSAQDFHQAFMFLPLCFLIAGLLACLVKETYCRGK